MKRILVMALLLVAFTSADAQKVGLGLTAAPGIAWLKPDTEGLEGDGSKVAFSYGIIFDYNFTDNYALASGIEVAYNGGKIINRDTSTSLTGEITTFKLQYIEVPITLKMKTNEIGYITYFGGCCWAMALKFMRLILKWMQDQIGSQWRLLTLSLMLVYTWALVTGCIVYRRPESQYVQESFELSAAF